jgi:hypothetical protein
MQTSAVDKLFVDLYGGLQLISKPFATRRRNSLQLKGARGND